MQTILPMSAKWSAYDTVNFIIQLRHRSGYVILLGWQYHNGGRLPVCWNIDSKNSRKEVLHGKYTKGKGIMYITLSELIQIGIFLVGFAALLKSKK